MEILTKLTKRNLKLNKKRTIGTIIGIVLSVALICALSGMFNSFQETLIQNTINERGNFHIALETINREQLSKYELNKDIKSISALYELGDSKYLNSSEDSPYITVYSINQEGFDTLSYTIIDGNFPKNSNEIVISKKMALQSKLKVGDYLELNIGTRKTNDGYKLGQYNPYQGEDKEYIDNPTYKKYKVVGISYRERNSSATYGITTNVENDNIHAYITLDNPKDYKQSFIELLNVDDYDDIRFSRNEELGFDFTINDELLGLVNLSKTDLIDNIKMDIEEMNYPIEQEKGHINYATDEVNNNLYNIYINSSGKVIVEIKYETFSLPLVYTYEF